MTGAIVTSGGTVAPLEFDSAKYWPTDVRAAILQYADSCTQLGLGPGSCVAIHRMLTDRTVIGLITLIELGCRVVPLSPTTRLEMVDEITAMINAAAIVAETSPALQVRRLHERDVSTIRHSRLDDAYILFTSGSSGTPKGVLGTRSDHQHRRDWGREAYVSPNIQWCAIVADPAFIDSLTTIMGVSRAGKHLIIPLLLVQRDLGRLAGFIESEQIEQITLAPSAVEALTAADPATFRSVRRWIFSGKELRASWATQTRAVTPNADIIDSYGSTQICGDVTVLTLVSRAAIPDQIPIRRPAPGVQAAIAAVSDNTAGSPRIGELRRDGDQVAHGFLGEVSVIELRFHTAVDGIRGFRTGNLVQEVGVEPQVLCWTDDVHKVRGRRVDTTTVAAMVESVVGVRAAHVWIHHAENGASALHADMLLEPDAAIDSEEIAADLSARVFGHLVPDYIVVVTSFGRGTSGKVPPRARTSSRQSQHPPKPRFATGNADAIACMPSDVTEEPDIRPTTDVTSIGLDSLRAAALANQTSRYLGCRVSAVDVIEVRTVQGPADSIPTMLYLEPGPDIREVSTGSDAPVRLVHPAIGAYLDYFPLLECIAFSIAARRHGCLVRVLPGLNPIIGSTDEEACQRQTGLDSRIAPHHGIRQLEKSLALPPDSPESDDAFTTDPIRPELRAGNQSYLQVIKDMAAAGRYTAQVWRR